MNDSTKPVVIHLPHPSSTTRNPLPLGLIVPTSAEPGFLVVMPASGHVTYWESLSGAAAIARHRQKQQGTHGTVSGMMSGEVICNVTEGEPHGFLLTFNTGRVAHMAVSDPQGHPSIRVEYLRGSADHAGGLLGSLRGVFSNAGWKRDIASVRAGISWQRGQRCAVVATTKGAFQVWDMNWNGMSSIMYEVDAREDLIKSLQEGGAMPSDQVDRPISEIQGNFEVVDFTFLPLQGTGNELARSTPKGSCRLVVLAAIKGVQSSRFALIGLNLTNGALAVDMVHPISCYTDPVPRETAFKPQILVPETAQIAFVVFERSIVLVSLVQIEDSPSSQLQIESNAFPDPFQDAIDFRKDKGYRVVGCAAELPDRSQKGSSCLVMVSNFGIIRVVALPVKEGQSAFDRAAVTAQTKIEQAVFYGNLPQNLLDFSGRREISFEEAEIEEAALAVSESIMKSTSPYIPTLAASMDQQLQRRSTALADLMKHLRETNRPVTRPVRWLLLWDAEKMAACHALWRWYDNAIANKPKDEQNLLYETVFMLHERYKTGNDPTNYETDRVRHWFTHDAWRLEYLVPMAQVAVEELYNYSVDIEETQDAATQARLLGEANDMQLSTLETAFEFRQKNVRLYGVEGEHMVDGVLRSGYEELPEIWTSTHHVVEKVRWFVDASREMAIKHDDVDENEGMVKLIEKLIEDNPRLVQLCCQTHIERFRWLNSRPDMKEEGWKIQKDHFDIRKIMFVKLSEIGLGREGIKLAEKYREMGALADIIHYALAEEIQHSTQPGVPDSERQEASQITQLLRKQILSYFGRFGAAWADAYFTKQIHLGYSIEVLNDTASYQEHLTQFLRTHPQYAKLSWMSEVHSEHNYATAAKDLETAEMQETSLWGKKIALSMSKLAILAAQTAQQANEESVDNLIHKTDQSIAVFTAQEKLYNYIRPVFRNAIDSTAENQLVADQYCKRFVKDKPTLGKVLKHNMAKLIARTALDSLELADILTLMDEEGLHPDDYGIADSRFFTALKVLRIASNIEGKRPRNDLDERIIWRRCMNLDDWEAINHTELKGDTQVEVETGSTALFKTLREWYQLGKLATSYQSCNFGSLIVRRSAVDLFVSSTPAPPPSSLLGAGTTVESLQSSIHYGKIPEEALALLAKDFALEDAILQKNIKKGRLEIWWKGIADAAQKSLRDEGDRKGEEAKHRKSVENGFWTALNQKDSEALTREIEGEENKKSSGGKEKRASTDKPRETSAEAQRKVNGEGQREVNGDIDVEMQMD